MSKYNVIFFPDEPLEHGQELKANLKEKNHCFHSANVDEFDQVYRQSGKFLLLFLDANKALQFIRKNYSAMTGLEFKTFVYLAQNGKFKPESQKRLDEAKIIIFQKDEVAQLLKKIEDFFNSSSESSDVDEITFLMPEDE